MFFKIKIFQFNYLQLFQLILMGTGDEMTTIRYEIHYLQSTPQVTKFYFYQKWKNSFYVTKVSLNMIFP